MHQRGTNTHYCKKVIRTYDLLFCFPLISFLSSFLFSFLLFCSTEFIFLGLIQKKETSSHLTCVLHMIHLPCAMCHMDTCTKWQMSHHMVLMPCALLIRGHAASTWSCHVAPLHVSPDTRCLEKREIQTISEFNGIRLSNLNSQEEFNDEVRFIIRDLEKFQVSTCTTTVNYCFANVQKNCIFLGFYMKSIPH